MRINNRNSCVACGCQDSLERFEGRSFEISCRGTVRTVDSLSGQQCRSCGEIFFDPESARRYSEVGDALVHGDVPDNWHDDPLEYTRPVSKIEKMVRETADDLHRFGLLSEQSRREIIGERRPDSDPDLGNDVGADDPQLR